VVKRDHTHSGGLAPETGLRWLFVDMNSFFASCEQQMNPELRGQSVVVSPVLAESTSAIAASHGAKAFGVKTRTPIWDARKRCPHITVIQAQPKLYVEYHHKIRETIET
jgi:DNA polymerase-4